MLLISTFLSHRPITLKHTQNRLKQNLHIQLQTPLTDILRIQLHYFLEVRNVASSTHLPHSGKAGAKCHSCSVVWFIQFPLIHCRWPCTYETHIASLCQVRNNFGHKKRASDYSETLFISPFPQTKHIFFLFFIPHTTLYPLSSKLFFHFLKSFFKWDKILIYYRFKTHFFL